MGKQNFKKSVFIFLVLLFVANIFGQEDIKVETPYLKSEGIPNLSKDLIRELVNSFKREASSFVNYKPNGDLVGYNSEYSPFVVDQNGKRTDFKIELRFPEDLLLNPKDGGSFLFAKDINGDEKDQIFSFNFENQKTEQLTNPTQITNVSSFIWNKSGTYIFFINADDKSGQDEVYRLNPTTKDLTKIVSLEGNSHFLSDSNDKNLVFYNRVSNNHRNYYLLDLETNQTRQISKEVANSQQGWLNHSNKGLFWLSDKEGHFNNLYYFDFLTGKEKKVNNSDLNISAFKVSPDETSIAFKTNENGAEQIRIFQLIEHKISMELPKPVLQPGVIERFGWKNNNEISFTLESHLNPPQVESWDWKTKELKILQIGKPAPQLVNNLGETSVIKWQSFDKKEITGILQKPKKIIGKLPVIVYIHGGPKLQYQPYYNVFKTFPVSYLSAATISANIRGSSGFGREFENLDNGEKRLDSIKDLESLINWIEQQPELDSSRIVVKGDSFGAFLALAVGLRNPQKIKGVIAESPVISVKNSFYYSPKNIQETLENEYGSKTVMDELENLSALSEKNIEKLISVPVFLAIGQKDVRVPLSDVENLKTKLKNKGTEVWFLKALNEGHYWGDYDNRMFLNLSEIMFLKERGF